MTEEKAKETVIALGPVFIGKLLTWNKAPIVRFIYNDKKYGSMIEDFTSKEAFKEWLKTQLIEWIERI